MTSSASICSVTRIVPMDDVMNEPIFPAMMIEMNVGANSKMTDCRVANPIKYFGISGLVKFSAVWMATTPPTKNEIKATMPNDSIIRLSISFKIKPRITDHFTGLRKISFHIKKYRPIWRK